MTVRPFAVYRINSITHHIRLQYLNTHFPLVVLIVYDTLYLLFKCKYVTQLVLKQFSYKNTSNSLYFSHSKQVFFSHYICFFTATEFSRTHRFKLLFRILTHSWTRYRMLRSRSTKDFNDKLKQCSKLFQCLLVICTDMYKSVYIVSFPFRN